MARPKLVSYAQRYHCSAANLNSNIGSNDELLLQSLVVVATAAISAFSFRPLLRFVLPGERGVRLFYYWHSAIHVIGVLASVIGIYIGMTGDEPAAGIFGLYFVLIFSLSLWGIRGVLNQPTKLDTKGH